MKTKMPIFCHVNLFCVILLLGSNFILINSICPEKCNCKNLSENNNGIKVKCGAAPNNKITSLKELEFGEDFENIVQLDLSKNQISYVTNIDFSNYTNLKRLDLSYNSLKQIDEAMFGEIPSLEKLKLSNNLIVHILQGSFEKLKKLKILDISANPLACDCDLLWLAGWSNSMQIKLQPPPHCETPAPFKDFLLKKLKVGSDLHCESPSQPLLELKPETDQLVFEGDELVLRCRAPRVAVGPAKDDEDLPEKAHVFWGWSDRIIDPNSPEDIIYRDPELIFPSIQIDAKHLADSGLLDSILKIPFVTRNHTGMWDCRLSSQQANLSRSITVIVVSNKTKYCPSYEVRNNKGKYFWPRTIRGKQVRLPCAGEVLPITEYATLNCSDTGEWTDLNTEFCPFISETTRVFEQFAKVNLSIAKGSVLESAKRLRNFTQSNLNLRKIRDPIDLVFITKTLTNYLNFVNQEKDLGTMLLDIVSQILKIPNLLAQQAQAIDNSGMKLIIAVEYAGQYTPLSMTHKPHLAIEYFQITSDSFNGMTCTWLYNSINLNEINVNQNDINENYRIFQCNTATTQSIDIFRQHVDASVQIPSNLLIQSQAQQTQEFPISQKLMVVVYENSNFLPYHKNQTNFQITSAVIGVKILSDQLLSSSNGVSSSRESLDLNLTEPISIMLRVMPYHNEISSPIPVWWDPETNSWTRQGCQISYFFHGLLVFTCQRLGYYGLLQNRKYLNDFLDENAGAKFRPSPIGFYIGGLVIFLSSWINIVTYIASGTDIQMARRQRHSLINTWLAISSLAFVFTIGIFQTEDYRMCQSFGIAIHYFSLCVILWVCVSLSNMYKRLSKRNRIPIDDFPKENVGRKPILGIYLVGWGIGLIICGISGAVNMREYSSYSYCFLGNGPALSAIFVPSTILLVFILILFICVRCHIRIVNEQQQLHTNQHFSENTQATENVDLELLESNTNNINQNNINNNGLNNHLNHHQNEQRYRSLTMSSPTTSSMQNDQEHTNSAQLRAHFIFLFLYLLCWLMAASSVVQPFENRGILYEEELFSILFAILAIFLSIFILFFYSISRSDVRAQWSMWSCRNFCRRIRENGCCCCCCSNNNRRRRHCNRSISDTKELNTTVTYHHAGIVGGNNGTINSGSRSNSQCSKNRSNSAQANHLKNEHNIATLQRNDSPNKILLNLTGNVIGGASAIGTNSLLRGSGVGGIVGVHNSVIMSQQQQQQQQELPNPDIFYNPNQINVARKFFKKQKRLAKRNNFELQRQMDRGGLGGASDFGDNGGATSDVSSNIGFTPASSYQKGRNHQAMSIFSSGSKVNNTNIHVRTGNDASGGGGNIGIGSGGLNAHYSKDSRSQFHHYHHHNPNILSDSCNESDMILDAERCLALGAESLRVLSAQQAASQQQQQQHHQHQQQSIKNNTNKINNNEMIANIYTNVPETNQPQHEIVTMRADDKFRKSQNINDLLEQDENVQTDNDDDDDDEHNDFNSQSGCGTDRTSTPLYVNSNVRNIILDNSMVFNVSSDDNQKLLKNDYDKIDLNDIKQQQTHNNNNNKNNLQINSPILAMNTLGLPTIDIDEQNEQNSSSICSTIKSNNNNNPLDLAKNETYVSESLKIGNQIYHDDNQDQAIRIINQQQKKSKSLIQLNGIINDDSLIDDFHNYDYTHETHIRSISCTNLSQLDDAELLSTIIEQSVKKPDMYDNNQIIQNQRLLDNNSPILFSPSLCEINDLPSPADRRKPIVLAEDSIIPPADEDLQLNSSANSSVGRLNSNIENGINGSSGGCNGGGNNSNSYCTNTNSNNSDSLNLFSQSLRRQFCTSSSPTCESDLNYQNSELSIRSHGLYAPQPDNDLNLTLTGDDDCFYPYQSSEISDIEPDDNDHNHNVGCVDNNDDDDDVFNDDFNNCSNDCLLLPHDQDQENMLIGSQTSLDELYQRITRRSNGNDANGVGGGCSSGGVHFEANKDNLDDCIGESNSILTDTTYGECGGGGVSLNQDSKNLIIDNSFEGHNSTLTSGGGGIGEIEDDSSQGSIISYIDPNNCSNNGTVQQ